MVLYILWFSLVTYRHTGKYNSGPELSIDGGQWVIVFHFKLALHIAHTYIYMHITHTYLYIYLHIAHCQPCGTLHTHIFICQASRIGQIVVKGIQFMVSLLCVSGVPLKSIWEKEISILERRDCKKEISWGKYCVPCMSTLHQLARHTCLQYMYLPT